MRFISRFSPYERALIAALAVSALLFSGSNLYFHFKHSVRLELVSAAR